MKHVLLMGNPNTGKSTVLNALTGAGAHVGNFAGTTVERVTAPWQIGGRSVLLTDVPGTYSLAAHAPEERVAFNALTVEPPDAVVVLVDGTRLIRSLYLVLQILDLCVPVVVGVNFMDEAREDGRVPDLEALSAMLGVPVVALTARRNEGFDALASAVLGVLDAPHTASPGPRHPWPEEVQRDIEAVRALLPGCSDAMAGWVLLSLDDEDAHLGDDVPMAAVRELLAAAKAAGRDPVGALITARYNWLDAHVPSLFSSDRSTSRRLSEQIDRFALHPVFGTLLFATVMALLFAGLFSWSDPFIGLVELAFDSVGGLVGSGFAMAVSAGWPVGLLGDFVVEGLIGGVGSILVFLPQIFLLFLFIAILEDSGYLARVAHLMDRVLRLAGLPGQAFVPLLSGYACAVPAIMATRTLPRARDRLLTMLVIPLTTCSARLPVYTLLIAALFPEYIDGWIVPIRPLAMAGMYLFGTLVSVFAVIVLGRFLLPSRGPDAVLELVPYRVPSAKVVFGHAWRSGMHFVREAGGVILVATVVLWALLTFPRVEPGSLLTPEVVAAAQSEGRDLDAVAAGLALEHSYGGQLGHAIEPVIRPLGFDWRMGVGILGSFAAREVFVATMGLVYGMGDEVDEDSGSLRDALREQSGATPLVGLSLMVFFALAMQCTSTLAVLVKETKSYRWPAFIFVYMTLLAYTASFITYQGGRLLGFDG